jgi:hypothetical protein
MKPVVLWSVVAVSSLLSAPPLLAETILTPFVGRTFGGVAQDDFGDDSHLVYGGTITFVGEGLAGFEIDGQYAPKFFGGQDESNVASLRGGLTLGGGGESLRLYAIAGAGLLKTRVPSRDQFFTANRNSFGVTLGGSGVVKLGDSLGVKGDLRYFRGLSNLTIDDPQEVDLNDFRFWRASVGLALHL